MSKAILVVDMPSSCDACDFVDDSESGKMWCGLPTFGYDVTDYIACRPDDCPLREIPEKAPVKDPKYPRNSHLKGYGEGYNACIDKILEGITLERLENADMSNSFIKNYWEHRQVGKWLGELKAYKDAEEQGLILRLPVAIGSDIYFIPSKTNFKLNVLNGLKENNRVYHQKVAKIIFKESCWFIECDKNLECGIDYLFIDKSYQETWFTSQEEAEQALKQMK